MKDLQLLHGLYTLKEEIASGGFATIYKATQRGTRGPVAIKVGIDSPDPGYNKSIKEESRIVGEFNHANIVKVLPIPREGKADIYCARAVGLQGNPFFFVMEYLSGGTLEDYAESVGPISVEESAAIGLVAARALYHIHRKGYAHNDLKLENLVFRTPVKEGQPFNPVLIDFGIANRVSLQVAAGSLYIMSPEQIEIASMDRAPDLMDEMDKTKVDVWGLGVILYRLLGGKVPFGGRNKNTLTSRIRSSRPTSLQKLASVDKHFDELIIDGCLAKNPHHRISMLDLGHELKRVGDGVVASKSGGDQKRSFFNRVFRG